MNTSPRRRLRSLGAKHGLTLVELLVAIGVSALLMAGVMAVVIALARIAIKNERLENAATTAREIQELITQELNAAINVYDNDENLINRPTFTDGSSEEGYRQITYRSPAGPPGNLIGDVPIGSSTVTFFARAALRPQVGDYFVLDTPKLGRGIRITSVSDTRAANADGNITVSLAESIDDGTVTGYKDALRTVADANSRVEIQRERAFIAEPPGEDALVTTLRWVENTSSGVGRDLTDMLAAENSRMFRQVPDDATAEETAISWFLVLYDARNNIRLPGAPVFFSTSSVGGTGAGGSTSLIMPKSGNSLTLSNPFAAVSTSISTTTTSTSTTTSTTSTTSTTKTTSTTSTSTTKTTSTSTTSVSTTKTTSTSTTSKSTTKTTSTSTTSKSTTKTTSKSTTSKSTTKTTSKSTTSKSTTKTTSTTSKSTSSTTSTKSTTASTTSSSKTTSTSSTSKSTTTSTTSKSTIPFDG